VVATAPASSPSYRVSDLTNGSAYYYTVTAVDRSGNESPASTEASGLATDQTAPAVPTDLVATGDDARVALGWADNAESDLDGYSVQRSTDGQTWSEIAAPAVSSYTDTGRTNGTEHSYRVVARDTTGNASAASLVVSATPAADTTAPETTIDAGPSGTVTSASAVFRFSSLDATATFQ
jgi:fibronectin type 3 domain-containing protein